MMLKLRRLNHVNIIVRLKHNLSCRALSTSLTMIHQLQHHQHHHRPHQMMTSCRYLSTISIEDYHESYSSNEPLLKKDIPKKKINMVSPIEVYETKVQHKDITDDKLQRRVINYLQGLYEEIVVYDKQINESNLSSTITTTTTTTNTSSNSWLFSSLSDIFNLNHHHQSPQQQQHNGEIKKPKSVYIWGGTGCGKTFLMDLFYECVPIQRKKRVHFHDFMIDIHKRIHTARTNAIMMQQQQEQQQHDSVKDQDHDHYHHQNHSSSSSRINQAIDRARNHQSSLSSISSTIASSLSSSSFFMNHHHNQQHTYHQPQPQLHQHHHHHSNSPKRHGSNEILAQIAADILHESYLICFDEFQVVFPIIDGNIM